MSESAQNDTLKLRGAGLSIEDLLHVGYGAQRVELHPSAIEAMELSHQVILKIIRRGKPVYGVNTGFGKFSEVQISPEELGHLQENLVRSHACGVGRHLPNELVRMILAAKANALSRGYSGCRPVVAQTLVEMLNRGVYPLIPAHGSVGASGDLAPLAHLALVMIGEGEACYENERQDGAEAMRKAGIEPLKLGPKEGLSVLNGTQVSLVLAIAAWMRLEAMARAGDVACAWSLQGIAGRLDAFDPRIHAVRGHPGAMEAARRIQLACEGSEILDSPEADRRVQDPYAFRCTPQVHGAVRDIVESTKAVLERELNGVTDNPLVFAEKEEVISGGNFHAEPIAFAADQIAIAGSELASISERRTYQLTDSQISGLAPFLVEEGGLNSGFMIHHVTQAALTSQNKTLSHPASVDSIPTSAGKEDHVSMATWAAFKAYEVMERTATVLGIEILAAAQALSLREPAKPSPYIRALQEDLRDEIPMVKKDRVAYPDIDAARGWLLRQALEI